jgi:AraC family transcriptional regulator
MADEHTAGALAAEPYRLARRETLHLVGLEAEVTVATAPVAIAALWRRFLTLPVAIPHAINQPPVGFCTLQCEIGSFLYACALQVTEPYEPPEGLVLHTVPPAEYAVFRHAGPVTSIAETDARIFEGVPVPGRKLAASGGILELFLPKFDPATGEGGVEIWIALEAEG